MKMTKEIVQAKIDARLYARELIKKVFQATYTFQRDKEGIASQLRQKTLSVSSFMANSTSKSNHEEQNESFLFVMGELRDILKLITIAEHLKLANPNQKKEVRDAISNLILAIDKIVLMRGNSQ